MNKKQSDYYAYLLRMWVEEREGQSVWRASLELPGPGKRQVFVNLESVIEFLKAQVGQQRPTGPGNIITVIFSGNKYSGAVHSNIAALSATCTGPLFYPYYITIFIVFGEESIFETGTAQVDRRRAGHTFKMSGGGFEIAGHINII